MKFMSKRSRKAKKKKIPSSFRHYGVGITLHSLEESQFMTSGAFELNKASDISGPREDVRAALCRAIEKIDSLMKLEGAKPELNSEIKIVGKLLASGFLEQNKFEWNPMAEVCGIALAQFIYIDKGCPNSTLTNIPGPWLFEMLTTMHERCYVPCSSPTPMRDLVLKLIDYLVDSGIIVNASEVRAAVTMGQTAYLRSSQQSLMGSSNYISQSYRSDAYH